MRYMLDTNICIYLMKGAPGSALRRLESLAVGEAVISAISLAELQAGVAMRPASRLQNSHALELLTAQIPVLPFAEAAAESYGDLRAQVPDRRRDALDRLIAAHAVSVGATLVTNNLADFQGYPGLMVENWVAED